MGPPWAIMMFIIGGFVPSLTAILLSWKQKGKVGLNHLIHRVFQLNIGWRWYLAIITIVVVGTFGQLAIIWIMGQQFDGTLFMLQLSSALPLIILGPLSEEIGWRGYALDRLQTKWNALLSSVILGLV